MGVRRFVVVAQAMSMAILRAAMKPYLDSPLDPVNVYGASKAADFNFQCFRQRSSSELFYGRVFLLTEKVSLKIFGPPSKGCSIRQ